MAQLAVDSPSHRLSFTCVRRHALEQPNAGKWAESRSRVAESSS